MGKKTSTSKPAAPARRAAKNKPASENGVLAAPAPAAKPKATVKATKPAAPRKKKAAYTHDDVALRAYFIGERRQAAGLPGDAHLDWVEAERQLALEAASAGKTKAKRA